MFGGLRVVDFRQRSQLELGSGGVRGGGRALSTTAQCSVAHGGAGVTAGGGAAAADGTRTASGKSNRSRVNADGGGIRTH